jgi:hypothetical protein
VLVNASFITMVPGFTPPIVDPDGNVILVPSAPICAAVFVPTVCKKRVVEDICASFQYKAELPKLYIALADGKISPVTIIAGLLLTGTDVFHVTLLLLTTLLLES